MIGFGEIRRLAGQWRMDLAEVERAYTAGWLLFGIFNQASLARALIVRGASALHHAYFADYPAPPTVELIATAVSDENHLRDLLADALQSAAEASGIKLTLADFDRGNARIEYTGPLGRRSAAQPRVTLAIVSGPTRVPPVRVPLIHRFSDACAATLQSIALEEFVAERIAWLAQSPRARDVFDLWFALEHAPDRLSATRTRELARQITQERQTTLPRADAPFSPAQHASLERAWGNALKNIPTRPSLEQVESALKAALLEFEK